MCGLAGYSGKGVDTTDIFTLMSFAQLRGKDSVGIYSKSHVYKSMGSPTNFVVNKFYEIRESVQDSKLVMVHSRAATMGRVTLNNAHPFIFKTEDRLESIKFNKEVIGTHNGWLFTSYLEDMAKEHGIKNPDVDSKLIYEILLKNEMDFNSLSTIEGTMALAFTIEGVLHLYRRTSKPLFFGAKSHGIFYSSVEDGLIAIGCNNIMEVSPNIMYKFKDGKLLDTIFVEDAKHVKNLPVDVSPSKWRDIVGEEISSRIPKFSLNVRNAQNRSASPPVRGKTMLNNVDFVDGKLRNIKIEVPLKKEQFRYKIWDAKARDSFILIKAVDANTKIPVSGQTFLSHASEGKCVTDESGYAIMHFGKFRGETRVYTGDPKSKDVMYSTMFNIKVGRVLEVTLNLPFRSSKEAKKENEGKTNRIGFSYKNDGKPEEKNIVIIDKDLLKGDKKRDVDTGITCGYEATMRISKGKGEGVRAVEDSVASRFNLTEKKAELCDMFGISDRIPDITLELLEIKNEELYELNEDIMHNKGLIDIGNNLDDEERHAVVDKIIQLETEYRYVDEHIQSIVDNYRK